MSIILYHAYVHKPITISHTCCIYTHTHQAFDPFKDAPVCIETPPRASTATVFHDGDKVSMINVDLLQSLHPTHVKSRSGNGYKSHCTPPGPV